MERKLRISINLLICSVILIGFFAVAITNYNTYSRIIKDDIVNISKLTSTNIYSDISNELTKPIFVSLTMANDSFVKNWLQEEAAGDVSQSHQRKLIDYLFGIKDKYGYDSAFLISEASKNYYYYNGLNKTISTSNEHDQWYYNFINENKLYNLDIDADEVNHNQLTVFINCRITDNNGNLLGVTGVGLKLNEVQSLLENFENNFNLHANLFNPDGIVQISSNSDDIENKNVFDTPVLGSNKEKILNNTESLETFEYTDHSSDGYLITRFIKDLEWYLLIQKDTSVLKHSLYQQLVSDIIIFAFVVLIVLIIVNWLIKRNDKALVRMAKTDFITNLPNRRGFNTSMEQVFANATEDDQLFVFVFDIDDFKKINDQYGHLIGDQIIRKIGDVAQNIFTKKNVFRWGGDEFAGFTLGDKEKTIRLIEKLFGQIRQDSELSAYPITISLGVTCSKKTDTINTVIYRADQALYQSKETGKNKYICTE